jgi:phage shock protein PspC (stress-responsive transcriptional regulator)
MTDVFNGIGRFFQWTFTFMKPLGNAPNIFFWLLIVTLIVVWLRMQSKFNKEAKEKNTLQ